MTRRAAIRLALVVATSLALAMCSVLWRTDELKFSHQKHTLVEGLDCQDCHRGMEEVTDLTGPHFPTEERCLKCHTDRKDDCTFCHENPEAARKLEPSLTPGLRFDHSAHIARAIYSGEAADGDQAGCTGCHREAMLGADVTGSRGPTMFEDCMSCHRQDFRQIDCLKCHTDFYADQLAPKTAFDHRGDFTRRHGQLALGDMTVCGHCHQPSSCAQCHSKMAAGVPDLLRSDEPDRWRLHDGNWIAKHAIEARASGGSSCMTCHSPDRCTSCHSDNAVAASGGPGLGPHPSGWLIAGSSAFHGDAARRDIGTCATCHDRGPDTNCISCHRVGGTGGSPHPPGWSTRIERDEGQACVWCHN